MIKKYGNIISGIAILIFSIAVFTNTFSFKLATIGLVGSGFMPRLVTILMAILSIILILNGVKEVKRKDILNDNENSAEKGVADRFSVIITFILIAVYIALLESVGFIIMTSVYLFAQIYVLSIKSQRKLGLFLILSVAISVGVYCMFTYAFKLILPTGILG